MRARLDWKYALCLPLEDPGFDASVLSEFRARLLAGEAEARLFETLLTLLREQGLVKARGQQRTDSTHVLAAIQVLNRLEFVGETLRHALNTLAAVAPAWLRARTRRVVRPLWPPLRGVPPAQGARRAQPYVRVVGEGLRLLAAVAAPEAPAWLRELPAVQTLRRAWVQQYYAGRGCGALARGRELPPAAARISSPMTRRRATAERATLGPATRST